MRDVPKRGPVRHVSGQHLHLELLGGDPHRRHHGPVPQPPAGQQHDIAVLHSSHSPLHRVPQVDVSIHLYRSGRVGSGRVGSGQSRSGQVRSGQVRVFKVHSDQAVVAHACHGHRYRPSTVPLTGKGKKKGGGGVRGYKGVREGGG